MLESSAAAAAGDPGAVGVNHLLELAYDDWPPAAEKENGFDDDDDEYDIKREGGRGRGAARKRKRGRPRKGEDRDSSSSTTKAKKPRKSSNPLGRNSIALLILQ